MTGKRASGVNQHAVAPGLAFVETVTESGDALSTETVCKQNDAVAGAKKVRAVTHKTDRLGNAPGVAAVFGDRITHQVHAPLGRIERTVGQFNYIGFGVEPIPTIVDVDRLAPRLPTVVADANRAGGSFGILAVKWHHQTAVGKFADRGAAMVVFIEPPHLGPRLTEIVRGDKPGA